MLRAQGLSQHQQTDFVVGALEGEAKCEIQLVEPRAKNTGQKVLDGQQKLYAKRATKAQLRASFFSCRQRPEERGGAFVLRLREVFFRCQEGDKGGPEGEDLLLYQFMVGLQPEPIKQELSKQMQCNDRMALTDTCKEAQALESLASRSSCSVSARKVTALQQRYGTVGEFVIPPVHVL